VKGHRLTKSIIDHGHTSLGYLGPDKTEHYLACFYWWPTMFKDILNFCKSCGQCQVAKDSTQKPKGLLHPLLVHIIPITMSTGAAALADKYLYEVVQLHGVASSIVSDQDP
jgi:Integrase zinc binding domain